MNEKVLAYCRCSTTNDKQDVNRQAREIANKYNNNIDSWYKEYVCSVKEGKEEFNNLKKYAEELRKNDAEVKITIVVTEISRLSRSVKQLIDLLEWVKANRLTLVIMSSSMNIDCYNGELDNQTKAYFQMLGVFAELEHGMIQERVRSGVANARAKGKQIGRPTITIDDVPKKVKDTYKDLYSKGQISKTDFARVCKISRPTLDKYLNIITSEEE